MKHIESNTTPYDVIPGGSQWVLRGNGHVYGVTKGGRLRVYLRRIRPMKYPKRPCRPSYPRVNEKPVHVPRMPRPGRLKRI